MTASPQLPPAVHLERVLPAPPDRVYRAWLDPELVRRWMAPTGMQVTRVDVEERVGGPYRVWHRTEDGEAGGFECEILELVPDRRLVFRWGFVGPGANRRAGVRFGPDGLSGRRTGGTTRLTLVHEKLDGLRAAMPPVAENVGPGWEMALDALAATVVSVDGGAGGP